MLAAEVSVAAVALELADLEVAAAVAAIPAKLEVDFVAVAAAVLAPIADGPVAWP